MLKINSIIYFFSLWPDGHVCLQCYAGKRNGPNEFESGSGHHDPHRAVGSNEDRGCLSDLKTLSNDPSGVPAKQVVSTQSYEVWSSGFNSVSFK